MNEPKDKESEKPKSFWEGFKEGYDEQDAKIRKDTAPLSEKIVEGIATGTSETIVHPFRWLRSILKGR